MGVTNVVQGRITLSQACSRFPRNGVITIAFVGRKDVVKLLNASVSASIALVHRIFNLSGLLSRRHVLCRF